MSFEVITIGAATIDAFVWSKQFRTVRSRAFPTGVGECFSLGSKIEIDHFVLGTGGGATNAAATFANLGYKTGCIAAVGDDLFGAGVRDDLRRQGISTAFVKTVPNAQTAFSTILVIPSGERTVLVARGASEKFSLEMFNWPRIKSSWIYMTSLGGNIALAEKILRHAKRRGIGVFWNPGSKDLAHGPHHLRPLIKLTRVFDVNREEAARLTGRTIDDLGGMVSDLVRLGAPIAILTDGENGAYLSEGGHTWRVLANKKIKVINRTGAGDAFGSGFLAGLIRYRDRTRALQLGVLNSQGVIQKIGAKTGLLKAFPSAALLKKIKITSLYVQSVRDLRYSRFRREASQGSRL